MSLSILRCNICGQTLGHKVGNVFVCGWNHREYVLRGVARLTCDSCSGEWTAARLAVRKNTLTFEQIADRAQVARLVCRTPECGRTLGEIGTAGDPCALIRFHRRQIVCSSIMLVACDKCRAYWEAPWDLDIEAAAAAAAEARAPSGSASILRPVPRLQAAV